MTDGSLSDLIRLAYRVALDPDRFDDLLESWDRFCARALADGAAPGDAAAAHEIDLIDSHFDQALELATDPRLDDAAVLDGYLAQQTAPTALLDDACSIVVANMLVTPGLRRAIAASADAIATDEIAAGLVAAGESAAGESAADRAPANGAAANGAAANGVAANGVGGGEGPRSAPMTDPETGEPLLAVLSPPPAAIARAAPAVRRVIRFGATAWPEAASGILREACGLSNSEVDVARMLASGLSPSDIAERRGRSLETVRSQIKSIQDKTGARRQTGLIQFLTMLRHLAAADDAGSTAAAAPREFDVAEARSADSRRIFYADYGAPHGRPALYLTTSSRPEESAAFRAEAARAGLRAIAPYRPGFGASDRGPSWFANREALLGDLSAVLDGAGVAPDAPLVIAGHREGGALAAIAAAALASSRRVDGVVLISTGAPAASFSAFDAAPISVRRSFLAARHAPFALRVGYRTAARLFRSGLAGENKIVGYFFKESPADSALMVDPGFRAITRDNIAYSFEDCDAIVEDIGVWISDWAVNARGTDALGAEARGAEAAPWRFIHGDAHGFHLADAVRAYAAADRGAEATIVSGAAQMLLYQHPRLVAEAIARIGAPVETGV